MPMMKRPYGELSMPNMVSTLPSMMYMAHGNKNSNANVSINMNWMDNYSSNKNKPKNLQPHSHSQVDGVTPFRHIS